MTERRVSFAKTSSTMLVSLVIAGILTQVVSIAIARLISVNDLGLFAIVLSLQNALGIVAAFGMRIAVAKFVAETHSDDAGAAMRYAQVGIKIVLLAAAVCALGYVALSGVLANDLYDEPRLIDLVPVSGLVVFFTAIHSAVFGVAQGCNRIRNMVVLQVAPPLILLSVIVALVPGGGVMGILLAYLASKGITVVVSVMMLQRTGFSVISSPILEFDRAKMRDLMNIALPSLLTTGLVLPIMWIGNTILTIEEGFVAMGLLTIALFFFNLLQIIPQSLVIPLVPHVSTLNKEDPGSAGVVPTQLVNMTAVFLVPLILIVGLGRNWIVEFLFGSQYEPASDIIFLLLASGYFASMASIVGAMMAGMGRMWTSLASNAVWASVFLVTVFLLVPSLGLKGIGMAFVISYGIHMLTYFLLAKRVCKVDFCRSYPLAVAGAAILIGGQIVMVEPSWLGQVGAATYAIVATCLILYLGRTSVTKMTSKVLEVLSLRSS